MAGNGLKPGDRVELNLKGTVDDLGAADGTVHIVFENEDSQVTWAWVLPHMVSKVAPDLPESFGSVIRGEDGRVWLRDIDYWNSDDGVTIPAPNTSTSEAELKRAIGDFTVLRLGLGLALDDTSEEG